MTLKNVQSLRAVAVCLVLVAHIYGVFDRVVARGPALDAVMGLGNAGVDLFFVISGFIMITVHWKNFGDRGITQRFLMRRVVRIVPLYWLITLGLALAFALEPKLDHTWKQANLPLSLLMLPMRGQPLLFVGWTLVYEMYFYYVFAALLNLSRNRAFVGLGIWTGVILLAQLWPNLDANPFTAQYLGTLVLEFLFGVVAGALIARGVSGFSYTAIGLGVVAIFGSLTYVLADDVPFEDGWHWRFLFFGLPMALILYGSVILERDRHQIMPAFMQSIGDASYSIYLWHTIIYALLGRVVLVLSKHIHIPWPTLVSVPVIAVVVSMVLYRLIEVPLLRICRQGAARLIPAPTRA